MAELNFGLLTPPGSQSVGNAFVSGMDQAAAARAQENQNALSQYTLGKAKREDELTTQLLGDLRVATTPEEIYRAYQRVGKPDIALKMQSERLTQDKLRGDILAQPGARAKTGAETAKLVEEAKHKTIVEIAGYPDSGSANAAIDYRLSNNLIDKATADRLRQGLTPENFTAWKLETLTRMLAPSEQLKQSAVTTKDTDMGGYISRQKYDAQGTPVGVPISLPKTAAPSTEAAILSAQAGARKWNPETLQFENVVPAGMPMRLPMAVDASGAAPANAMGTSSAAPVTAMIARPAAQAAAPAAAAPAATGGYSNRVLREMAVKGMQPDNKGGQTFISGGEKDPAVIVRLETAKAEGAATGKDMVAAVRTLPNAIASSQKALANIDAMLGDSRVVGDKIVFSKGKGPHPGFENAVGAGIGLRFIPGTNASDFQERFREVTSGAFLEAFESLRGGGSITEKEGEKATAAKTRMSLAQSEKEFVTAAREYQNIIRVGIGRAQERLAKAQAGSASNTSGGAPTVNIDALLKKYE